LKKVPGTVIQHELLMGGRKLIVCRNAMYVFEDMELSKTIELGETGKHIVEVLKIARGLLLRLSDDSIRLMVDDQEELSFVMVGPIQLKLEA
jgi:hypothetical protein